MTGGWHRGITTLPEKGSSVGVAEVKAPNLWHMRSGQRRCSVMVLLCPRRVHSTRDSALSPRVMSGSLAQPQAAPR